MCFKLARRKRLGSSALNRLHGVDATTLHLQALVDLCAAQKAFRHKPDSETYAIIDNTAAIIIRIGFWGPLYYNYESGTPKVTITDTYFRPLWIEPRPFIS